MSEKKDQNRKGTMIAPAYQSSVSRKEMGKFKQALHEHEAAKTVQARGEDIMQFVSDLAHEIMPLRTKRLNKLNEGRESKLTLNDIKKTDLEQPIEKCIREFCVVANAINKSQKPTSQKGVGSSAVYSEKSVQDLERLKTKFINEVQTLKSESNEQKPTMTDKVKATLSPQKAAAAQADQKYAKSLHTVATNVITKHHLDQSESLPTPPPRPQ